MKLFTDLLPLFWGSLLVSHLPCGFLHSNRSFLTRSSCILCREPSRGYGRCRVARRQFLRNSLDRSSTSSSLRSAVTTSVDDSDTSATLSERQFTSVISSSALPLVSEVTACKHPQEIKRRKPIHSLSRVQLFACLCFSLCRR